MMTRPKRKKEKETQKDEKGIGFRRECPRGRLVEPGDWSANGDILHLASIRPHRLGGILLSM